MARQSGNADEILPEISPSELKVLIFLSSLSSGKQPVAEKEIQMPELGAREVSSAISWLEKKGLVQIDRREDVSYQLTAEGRRFIESGLPEEKAFELMVQAGKITTSALIGRLGEKDGRIALAQLARLGLKPVSGELNPSNRNELEAVFQKRKQFLSDIEKTRTPDAQLLDHFRKREDVISEKKDTVRIVTINALGRRAASEVKLKETIGEITPEILQSGSWKNIGFRRYDLNAPVEKIYSASFHPLTHLIEKVRRIFLDLGFTEMDGHYIESAAWNMDALFIPQDHPARDMQDTFYLKSEKPFVIENPEAMEIFRQSHEKGIPGYRGWGYKWSEERARQILLRTHTTVSTIRYLYNHKEAPQAAFSVEKVFRHESVDWKHLAELHQIEGTYYGKDANLSTLMWLMKEFYSRLGFNDLKFVPSYYPYTEPSMDVVATVNGKEMELGGSGVFRPEVTKPLGLKEPVVAWGLGLERLAMIYYGLDDIRKIYQSDIDWLRTFSIHY